MCHLLMLTYIVDTNCLLQQAVSNNFCPNETIIAVAHHLDTVIESYDKIIVLGNS